MDERLKDSDFAAAAIAGYLKDFELQPPATPASTGKMQKRLRFPLPEDYKAFLLMAPARPI